MKQKYQGEYTVQRAKCVTRDATMCEKLTHKQRNLLKALQLGLINWFQFFEHWRQQ